MQDAIVKVWGKIIGAVSWRPEDGYADFEYTSDYAENKWDLAPIKMPIGQTGRVFRFPEFRRKSNKELDTFKGLPGLLADSLPDRFGTTLIHSWLARQGRSAESLNPVELLSFIGTRGMGALEFEPSISKVSNTSTKLEIAGIVDVARQLLLSKEQLTTNVANKENAVLDILRVGTSAGGARPKAVIAWNPQTGDIKSGQGSTTKGYEHYLLKLDGVSDIQLGDSAGYGRVEMAYHNMAKAAGIKMTDCRLFEENGRAHFMTKRFDREDSNIKHHIQTWCALAHHDYNFVGQFSYEQLLETMRLLGLPYTDAVQLFKRMVFNVIARNCDDHTKNFAFRMRKATRTWELTPAYDICHAYNPGNRWVSKHALSINGKREEFTTEDLLTVADLIGYRSGKETILEISEVVSNWLSFAEDVNVDSKKRSAINDTLLKFK